MLADGDSLVRQQTFRTTTHGGQDYGNVYCFVYRMNAAHKIQYLTEHGNTWHAYNVLSNRKLEPAQPRARSHLINSERRPRPSQDGSHPGSNP
jgi:hypothetical protein